MQERSLPLSDRYDPKTQRVLRYEAAQLDDQLRDLQDVVAGLHVEHLQWQPEPGRNTIGMLLAHIAVAEVFWMQVAAAGPHGTPEAEGRVKEVIGIAGHEDGMPLAACGAHPASLAGMRIEDYLAMLADAREATHATLSSWQDEDLVQTYVLEDDRISRAWTVYHVLEHLSSHLGQIRLLKRGMKDTGALA